MTQRGNTQKSGFSLPQYISIVLYVVPAVFLGVSIQYVFNNKEWLRQRIMELILLETRVRLNVFALAVAAACAILAVMLTKKRVPVYILDFDVYKPADSLMGTHAKFRDGHAAIPQLSEQSYQFVEKVLYRGGVGQQAYFPPVMHEAEASQREPKPSMARAREEFETVVFPTVQRILDRTGVHPKDISVLVVNCSLFNPTPSLCSMVIKEFGLRHDITSYNLAGMGCSAGLLAMENARQILQMKPSTYALVVSTENITQNWYLGNKKSMLIPNAIFRMGGAAVLLTNKRKEWFRAKYEVEPVVRTIQADEDGQQAVYQTEDEDGVVGVRLSKQLTSVAGKVLQKNIATFARTALPLSEQLAFATVKIGQLLGLTKESYMPDFKRAFEHFCIHTGGRAVIEAMEKNLSLPEQKIEPSKASLWRFGNVSSASLWYTLAYIESYQGVKRGDRVWQLGFGSGFKVNSTKLTAIRTNDKMHDAWDNWNKKVELELMNTLYAST